MITRSHRTRVTGLAVALALGAGALVGISAQSASATSAPITTAHATWGFKQSFRSYVGNGNGTITATEGAAFAGTTTTGTPPKNTSSVNWPAAAAAGSYDPATKSGTVHLAGRVAYTFPLHEINDLEFANPTVVLNGDGTGSLLVDVKYNLYGGTLTNAPVESGDDDQVAIATLSAVPLPTVTPACDGTTTTTFPNIATKLTDAGAARFSDFGYGAGTVIDPVTVSFAQATTDGSSPLCASTLTVAAPSTVYGKARALTVTVGATGGIATGAVTLREGSTLRGSATLSGGRAVVAIPTTLSVGKHTFAVSYAGSATVAPTSKAVTLSIAKATPKLSAALAKKTLTTAKHGKVTVKVTASGFVTSGKVTVTEGKKALKSASLSKGKATLTLPKLKKGSHKLVVHYAGTSTTVAKTAKLTLKVTKKK